MVPSAYRDLFRIREARMPLLASGVGRLPLGATGLAVILLVRSTTGSFADAGLVEAAFTLGAAVGVPTLGRLIDRRGQTAVLVASSVASSAALVAFVVSAHDGGSVAFFAAMNLLAGALVPPLSLCMRSLWGTLLRGDEPGLQAAYALDAVMIELAFITGPLITAGLAVAVSPSAAVLAAAALATAGGLAFATSRASRQWRGLDGPRHWAGALRSPGIRVLGLGSFGLGFANGALILALTAFGAEHGSPEAVGVLISIQAVASMVGGIWYGTRHWRAPLERRFAVAMTLLGLGFAPLVLAPSIVAMAALITLAGFALAPSTAIEYLLIDRIAPRGTTTEAFGWVITAAVAGAGAGEAIAGAVVNGGHITEGLLLALLGALGGAVVAIAGRRYLASG